MGNMALVSNLLKFINSLVTIQSHRHAGMGGSNNVEVGAGMVSGVTMLVVVGIEVSGGWLNEASADASDSWSSC